MPAPDGHPGEVVSRQAALDGLRGIAAVGVALGHAFTFKSVFFWMWSFVDLFFVLSGYLIGSILIIGISSGKFSLKNFWVRRILRIWPVYFLTLFACCALDLAVGIHGQFGANPLHLLRSVLFVQFFEGYVVPDQTFVEIYRRFIFGFNHSWSLAVEEQFYLLAPLVLMVFLARGRVRWILAVMALAVGAAVHLRAAGAPMILLLTRIDGLVLGLLLALAIHHGPVFSLLKRHLAAFAGVAFAIGLLIVAPYWMSGYAKLWRGATLEGMEEFNRPFLVLGFALLYSAIVAGLISGRLTALRRALSVRPLVYLGGVSYAIYMYHLPILVLLQQVLHTSGGGLSLRYQLLYWPALFGAAHLSKILMEDRLNALKARFPVIARHPDVP